MIWEFQDKNRFTIRETKGIPIVGRYMLDTGKTPWWIDVEQNDDKPELGGGGPRPGILAIKDHRLELCVAGGASRPRPEKMVSEKVSRHILYEMQRVVEPSGMSSDDPEG
jgi:uncharacterized protein (TIGR03067 family)